MKIGNLKEVRNELNKREKVKSYNVTLPYPVSRYSTEKGANELYMLQDILKIKGEFKAEDICNWNGTKVYDYYGNYIDLEAWLAYFRVDLVALDENLKKCEFSVANQNKTMKIVDYGAYQDLIKYLDEQFSEGSIKDEVLQKMTYNNEKLFYNASIAQKKLNEKAKDKAEKYMQEVKKSVCYKNACDAIGKESIILKIETKEHKHK